MTPITEIGEMVISDTQTDYFFRPSLAAMTHIGSPSEIVEVYATLSGCEVAQVVAMAQDAYGKIPEWLITTLRKPVYGRKILSAAMHAMQACCDVDITPLVGEWRPGKRGVVYRAGGMSVGEIILIAHTLIEHGVMGKAPLRVLQRNEAKDQFTKEFRAIDYISAAQAHLGMSRADAECLTMTHFQLLMKAKYPEPKGFTRAEYDAVMDADDKRIEELKAGKRRLVKSMRDVRKAA